MKRTIKRLILSMIVTCGMMFLSGCVALEPDFEMSKEKTIELGTITFEEIDFDEELRKKQEEKADKKPDDKEEPDKEAVESDALNEFYFQQFNADEQQVYRLILEGLLNHEQTIVISECKTDRLADIFFCVLGDHPEIYWTKTFSTLTYSTEPDRIDVQPVYFYNKEKCVELDAKIDAVVQTYLEGTKTLATDYDKILYTYEFVVGHATYGGQRELCQNIETFFVSKETVCAGYAKSMKYLLNMIGIECAYITGQSTNEEGTDDHAWNLVKCEEDYCLLDATWGDPKPQEGVAETGIDNINYSYFLNSDEFFTRTHAPDPLYEYPACTTNKWNYYVMNNMYFETFDRAAMLAYLQESLAKNDKSTIMQFKNQADYQSMLTIMKNNLFTEFKNELPDTVQGLEYTCDQESQMIKINWKYN